MPQADSLLQAFSSGEATLTAPSLIRNEIASALVVASRRGRLSSDQLLPRLQSFLNLGLAQPIDEEDTLVSAIELTTQFPVAFYDALYLALAQQLGFNYVTADEKFHENTKDKAPQVIWIGDLEVNG